MASSITRRPSIAIKPWSVGSPCVHALRKSLTSAFWRLVTVRRRASASFVTAIDCNHTQWGFMDKARENIHHGGTDTRSKKDRLGDREIGSSGDRKFGKSGSRAIRN